MGIWRKLIVAAAAPLLLTGCLWGPGKFQSTLTLKRDGTFTLAYRGEVLLQRPSELDGGNRARPPAWQDSMARCTRDGKTTAQAPPIVRVPGSAGAAAAANARPCTRAEIAEQRKRYETAEAERAQRRRREEENMAKALGLPGLDEESNRAFAARLSKYAGWRRVEYRGNGVFDVDYLMNGSARQDFIFPAMPDNDLILPFVAMRRRADGSVQVTAPMFASQPGIYGRLMAMGRAGSSTDRSSQSRAQGRFTVITDGEILTNNSEDGPQANTIGRQIVWEVGPQSPKVPEALIRL